MEPQEDIYKLGELMVRIVGESQKPGFVRVQKTTAQGWHGVFAALRTALIPA